jgi:hypothetical protein
MMYEILRGEISNTLKGALMLLERERIEEALRENERLASLGQMIGPPGIEQHDRRQPEVGGSLQGG